MNITDILKCKEEITGDLLLEILNEVCANGDVMIIKADGIRTSSRYTAVITSSQNKFEAIRFDSETISDAVIKVLNEYVRQINE